MKVTVIISFPMTLRAVTILFPTLLFVFIILTHTFGTLAFFIIAPRVRYLG